MVLAGHALPLYVHFVLKRLLTWLGTPVPTLTIIHTVNAGLAAVGTLLFPTGRPDVGESRSSRTASWSHCCSASGGPGGWSGSAFSCRSPAAWYGWSPTSSSSTRGFQPASTEYYMVSLAPLLLLLGPIAARPPGSAPGVRPFLTGSVAVLLAALVVVNVWAAIPHVGVKEVLKQKAGRRGFRSSTR